MITDEDVTKLKKTFVTKDEFSHLSEKVDGIQERLGDLSVEVGEIKDRLDSVEAKIDSIDTKFDGMIGLLEASMQEHGAGAVHLARHDRQIAALATAARTTLPG